VTTILGVTLTEGTKYRITTTGQPIELTYIEDDGENLIMDNRHLVNSEMVGGTAWIDKATITAIEPA
jgi:hypothetical protein